MKNMIGIKINLQSIIKLIALGLFLLCLTSCIKDKDLNNDTPFIEEESNDNPSLDAPNLEEITKMFITINENKLEVTLAENEAVDALIEILKKGNIVYTADDYGDFEKVGALGYTLPTSNTQMTTEPGDVILYSGNQLVLFYGNNSWSYTKIGKITGYTTAELRNLLKAGQGKVQVTISLN